MQKNVLFAAVMTVNLGLSAGAFASTIIYQDNFTGSGTDLNGATPSPTNTSAATWIAATATPTAFTENSGLVSVAAYNHASVGYNAYLPLTLSNAGTYTLQATETPTNNTSSDWLALGFTGATLGNGTGSFYGVANTNAWIFYRGNGQMSSFYGGGTSNQVAGITVAAGTPDTFTISINTVTDGVSLTDSLGKLSSTSGTLSPSQISAIHYVGIGQINTVTGNYSNFSVTFTPVPEPASLALLGLGSLGLLKRRRRA